MRVILLVILSALALLVAAATLAGHRWRRATDALVAQLGPTGPLAATRVSFGELEGLPAPVQRYLRTVLREGQPLIVAARLEQEGDFLLTPPDGWKPFRATQHVAVQPPGFVWDARIVVARGLATLVRDGLVGGRGSMRAGVAGVVTLVNVQGTPDITAGALFRYLAEAVWFPTALLPSQGVRWAAVDDSTARAGISAGGVTVALEFGFGADGLVHTVYADARPRDVDGRGVPTPWRGRWLEYDDLGGMRVPVRGEVAWLMPEGPLVYWRGRVTGASYVTAAD
jgi:hypothetical protein